MERGAHPDEPDVDRVSPLARLCLDWPDVGTAERRAKCEEDSIHELSSSELKDRRQLEVEDHRRRLAVGRLLELSLRSLQA